MINRTTNFSPPAGQTSFQRNGTSKLNGRAPAPKELGESARAEISDDGPNSSEGDAAPAPTKRRGNGRVIAIGAVVLLVVGVGVFAYLRYASGFVSTDDAFLSGDVHPISARVSGTVSEILTDDNRSAAAGEILIRLDPRDFEVQLQAKRGDLLSAQAAVTQADAQIGQAQAQIAQAEAQIGQTTAQLEKAEADYKRSEELLRKNVSARSEFDAAKAAYDVARSNAANTGAAREAALAALRSAQAARAVALARQETAQASVDDAQLQLSYTKIPAPAAGRIGKKSVETGQRVQPGQALLAVVGRDDWVIANFKESQLARMKPDQQVQIDVDAVGGHSFTGYVESFSPGTGAQFALLPPDNATGNFTKIVQRVPVKIRFDRESVRGFEDRLTPGLSAVVKVRL